MWWTAIKVFVKGLSGWRLAAVAGGIAVILGGGGGFYAGIRWQKGAEFDALSEAIATERIQAERVLKSLQGAWEAKWNAAQREVSEWQAQSELDKLRADFAEAQHRDMEKRFEKLRNEQDRIENFGECRLTDDALGLLDAVQADRLNSTTTRRSD